MATDLVEYTTQLVRDRITRVAETLRRMADDVDNLQSRVERDPTLAARSAVNTVLWGVAHLSLDSLVGEAADAVDARKDT